MAYSPPRIFLYFALACEAHPVIQYYRLKKNPSVFAFPVYRNQDMTLIVTGIGKTAMAAGIAYTQALFSPDCRPIMLNIGIAGHRNHRLGSIFIIDKITDKDTERRFYPPLVYAPPCPTHSLVTLSRPQVTYPPESLCDMEASAFYETSTRFSSSELIQCLKIISDNEESPTQHIQPMIVSEQIARHLSIIDKVIHELTELQLCITVPELPEFESKLKEYRFSVAEQAQLKKLLSRYRLIKNHDVIQISAKTGKEYLRILKQHLDQAEFYL